MAKLFAGHYIFRWPAPPIPDSPAPTIITSTCSTVRETTRAARHCQPSDQPQRSTKGRKVLLNNFGSFCVLTWRRRRHDIIRSFDFAFGGGAVWRARAGDYGIFTRRLSGIDRAWFY